MNGLRESYKESIWPATNCIISLSLRDYINFASEKDTEFYQLSMQVCRELPEFETLPLLMKLERIKINWLHTVCRYAPHIHQCLQSIFSTYYTKLSVNCLFKALNEFKLKSCQLKFYNFSRSIIFIFVISPSKVVYKI